MTDVPQGDAESGDNPEPYVPSGVRRSTYTPPGSGATDFDDDALAAAMAAEVAAYTSPVSIIPPVAHPLPPAAPVEAPTPVEPLEPVGWGEPAAAVEVEGASDDEPSISTPVIETSLSPTLEAIERLENELRRRADEARVVATPPPLAPEGSPYPDAPLFPAPPTFLRPAPPEGFEAPVEPAPVEPAPVEPAPAEAAPVEPTEPPTWGAAAFGEPPLIAPPPLVEPPVPAPGFDSPPTTAAIDLPPPAAEAAVDLPPPSAPEDFTHLPPPIGLEPAAIPPYDPTGETAPRLGELAPPPADFEALLGQPTGSVPAPHPDDLGPGTSVPEPQDPARHDPAPYEDDDVDDVDRAFGTGAIAVDSTGSVHVVAPPSEPIPTVRLAEDEHALVDEEPQSHPALVVESAGTEPTALDLRAGRAARLFWLWFATNSSIVSLSLGAVLFGLGMSLRQALVAILIGVALSFLPLGLVTLAGKWSGQPTMVVSRATFGVVGNGVPAVLALISRIFWGGALLWILATGVARILVDAGLDAGLGELVWTLVGLGAGFAIAFVVAIFGYGLIARVQLVLSILTAVLVVGVVVLTFPRLDLAAAQGIDDGPWTLLVTGVVLVFSFVGLAWVHSSADVARYQRTESDGGSTMLWATFGATLPAFILIAWGALLAASDPLIADGLATDPLYTIAALLPLWYPAPLIAALALGLLSGVVLTIYSGGFALQSLGVRARRSVTTVIAGILVLAAGAALVFLAGDARGLIRDIATTIAVPVAAWAGIFGAEIMIRRHGFDTESLLRRGGIYPAVRWANLAGLVVISAIGFGLTSAVLPGLDWQGYLLPFLGLAGDDPLLTSDVGVLAALVLGLLLPLVSAVPAIRRQERALLD
jgi:purine-cytosine permease-like protein